MSCVASTTFPNQGSSNLGRIGANDPATSPINDFIPDPPTIVSSAAAASASRSSLQVTSFSPITSEGSPTDSPLQGLSPIGLSNHSMGSPLEGLLSSSLGSSNMSMEFPLEGLAISPIGSGRPSIGSRLEAIPPSPIGSGRPCLGSRQEGLPPSPIGSGRPSTGSRLEVRPPSPIGSGRRYIGSRPEALSYAAEASGSRYMDSPLDIVPYSSARAHSAANGMLAQSSRDPSYSAVASGRRSMEWSLKDVPCTSALPSINGLAASFTQDVSFTSACALPSMNGLSALSTPQAITYSSDRSAMELSSQIRRCLVSMGFSCNKHRLAHSFFCHACHIPACTECIAQEHSGHEFIFIQDAINSARETSRKLYVETRQTIGTIKRAVANIRRVYDNVEQRSITAVTETKKLIRSYINALNNREAELLQYIDKTRQLKGSLLTGQLENLSRALTELTRISNLLIESANITDTTDLLGVIDTVTNEMRELGATQPELTPCEDDDVLFLPPDNTVFRLLSTIGSIGINNSSRVLASNQNNIFLTIPRRVTEVQPMSQSIYGANNIAVEHNPAPSLIFGSEGKDDGELCRPWGVCCDFMGHLFVTDRSNNRIKVFSPQGVFLYKFGVHGTGPGEFDRPAGITINPRGQIVVADKDNHRIQIFKIDGTFVSMFGEKGIENGQFNYPWDVACNKQGHILVSDTRNHRIQIFDSNGKFFKKFGYEVNSYRSKIFDSPRGVCFAPNGNIIVTDFNNHKLIVINERTSDIHYFGKEGTGSEQFLRPQGVVCDDNGKVIVADSRNNRIQVLDLSGNFLWAVGNFGTGPGLFDRPSGICLNPDGRIAVVDFGNSRVQMF